MVCTLQYDNIEKVNYELTERIRIVTCQPFFTFPIWINQDVIIVRVGKSPLPPAPLPRQPHKTAPSLRVWSSTLYLAPQVCILVLYLAVMIKFKIKFFGKPFHYEVYVR